MPNGGLLHDGMGGPRSNQDYDWDASRCPRSGVSHCLLRALAQVVGAGSLGRIAGLHIHMAERGSVLRKALFIYLGRLLKRPVVIHMHAATFPEFSSAYRPKLGEARSQTS